MSDDLHILSNDINDIDGNQIAPSGSAVSKALLTKVSGQGNGSGARMQIGGSELSSDIQSVFDDPEVNEPLHEVLQVVAPQRPRRPGGVDEGLDDLPKRVDFWISKPPPLRPPRGLPWKTGNCAWL